jgi:F-type H+-transporting ATPase subunit b
MKKIMPIFSLLIVAIAGVALASEATHEGGHEAITFMGDWLPRLVNFAIIATVVVYFMKKPAQDFFKNRTAEIAKAMKDSQETRERAVAALTEMERKIKDLEAEALTEEGRKVAQEVQQQVKTGIEIEVQKARTALAIEASLLSLDLAEGRIKEKIGDTDHERIVKEYITKVGGRG